jgi:hypothetical protein
LYGLFAHEFGHILAVRSEDPLGTYDEAYVDALMMDEFGLQIDYEDVDLPDGRLAESLQVMDMPSDDFVGIDDE